MNGNKPFSIDIHEMRFMVERLFPRHGFTTFKFERMDKPGCTFNVVKLPDSEFCILRRPGLEQEIIDAEPLITDAVKNIYQYMPDEG